MSQIMRLRRKAGSDHEIVDRNNGHRHEDAFITLVRDYGLLNEA
jgi:succinate dehydrogenase / fumarate reductase iron-sulfur subunit